MTEESLLRTWQALDADKKRQVLRHHIRTTLSTTFLVAGCLLFWGIYKQDQLKPIHSLFLFWHTPLYYPLLNLLFLLCVLALIPRLYRTAACFFRLCREGWGPRRAWQDPSGLARAFLQAPSVSAWPNPADGPARRPGSSAPTDVLSRFPAGPGSSDGSDVSAGRLRILPCRLRLRDLLIFVSLGACSWGLLEAFRLKENPEGACVGSDYTTFLTNIVATGLERWDLYQPAKRLPYSWLSMQLAHLTQLTYLDAGQKISFLSVALLPPLTYLIALPVTGTLTAVLAALLVLSVPLLHPFAIYTGSYGLFFLTIALTVAAGVWAVVTRRPVLYLLLGLASALCIQTQVKGITTVLAVTGMVAMLTLPMGLRKFLSRMAILLLPQILSYFVTSLLPVEYPTLGSMVAINREEVHRDMPFRRQRIAEPNLLEPSPISRWLPQWLRGGELETFAAVVLAPPDSDIVLLHRVDADETAQDADEIARVEGKTARNAGETTRIEAEVRPNTTIPPLRVRLIGNLKVLADRFPGVNWVLALLIGLAMVSLLLPFSRRLPPCNRWAGWVVFAAITPLWGPLSLNFHTRYLMTIVPPAAVLVAHGIQVLVWPWLDSRTSLSRYARSLLVVWFAGCLCVSLFTGSHREWLKPGLEIARLPSYLGIENLESHTNRSVAYRRMADWIAASLPADARVHDCTPVSIWLIFPHDPRYVAPYARQPERDRRCRELSLASSAQPEKTYVIVSNIDEFRGPDTISPEPFLEHKDRWRLVYGIEPDTLEVFEDPGTHTPSADALLLFQSR